MMGRMRCLFAMAEWESLAQLAAKMWRMPIVGTHIRENHSTACALP